MFEALREKPGGRGRRSAYVLVSAALQAAAVVGVVALPALRPAAPETAPIEVRIARPALPAGMPLAPARAAPRAPTPRPVRLPEPPRLLAPRGVPESLPPPEAAPGPAPGTGVAGVADLGGAGAGAPAAAGEEDGVIGGGAGGPGGGALLPLEPAPLPEADLAAVRERIVRSLSYPPRARKMGWEGRVVVGFVLLADGRVRDLRVLSSSGHEALDEAALAAVRRAAPYPPPGRDRLVRTPVSFRLD